MPALCSTWMHAVYLRAFACMVAMCRHRYGSSAVLQVLLQCIVEEYYALRKAATISCPSCSTPTSPTISSDSKIKAA